MSEERVRPEAVEAVRECVFMRGFDGSILMITPPWADGVKRQMRDCEAMASKPGYLDSVANSQ